MATELNEASFQTEVLDAETPVLIDFWAVWCGPCRMLTPTIESLASEYQGKVKVGKVNVDENQQLAAKYGIMSIPTVMIFNGGKVVEQFIGVQPKGVYEDALKKYI
ncbi:MAG: thioredoxin [Peptostreptococcales bacterium]|uniref:Thioredoxin n=1 Tax=Denitrovibrio acetiphilus (strain DSM 12809 / NBRC 114555 / N2460) TaxID=522772 RepID=D4H7P4_DENA2|nr:thioredoxin [Denitrovibrio acetiphilus]ADD68043.1 thioredoxin [Denitrovibrio acetiphilus DSM 12809]